MHPFPFSCSLRWSCSLVFPTAISNLTGSCICKLLEKRQLSGVSCIESVEINFWCLFYFWKTYWNHPFCRKHRPHPQDETNFCDQIEYNDTLTTVLEYNQVVLSDTLPRCKALACNLLLAQIYWVNPTTSAMLCSILHSFFPSALRHIENPGGVVPEVCLLRDVQSQPATGIRAR